jgi:phospholipase C
MQTHSHLSLLRFAERVFGLPPLNERVANASDMMDCFDFNAPPSPPDLPPLPPCAYAHSSPSSSIKAR